MNYSNFNYKEACSVYTMEELECILFKSRRESCFEYAKHTMKKHGMCDLLSFIVVGVLVLGFIIITYSYSLFDYLQYILTHDNSMKKNLLRYSEIKWPAVKVETSEYTTLEDIHRVSEVFRAYTESVSTTNTNTSVDSEDYSLDSQPMYVGLKRSKRKKNSLSEETIAYSTLKHTLNHSNILCGVVLSTNFRDVKGDELLQYNSLGEFSKPYLTQVVSFGDEINSALRVLLKGKVKFQYKKKENKYYVRIDDGDKEPLIKSLREVMGNSNINISLVQGN